MELKHQCILIWILLLHNRTVCLDPESYGTKESSGYKAAYAKAREMREMRFAAKGEEGPAEAALEQTFQVLRPETATVRDTEVNPSFARRDTLSTWSPALSPASS